MKTEVHLAIICIIAMWLFVLGVIVTESTVRYKSGVEVEKAIANCEANLPRNQKCVVVGYEFKIEEIEE